MKIIVTLCVLLFTSLNIVFAQSPFKISENHRYILKDGKPFFWLGDTAWELFHKLSREEADYYLKSRSEQGFTVIQAVVLAELNGLKQPNAYGSLPLINEDLSKPNEEYFKHVDYIINKAQQYGLTIALLPTWGDKLWKSGWGAGPEIFNENNAKTYGNWIGKRYKDKKNIVWILGGDRNPRNAADIAIWNSMAAGLTAGTGGNDKAMISFHPQPNEQGAGQWFYNEPWLDFNMFQTGHCRDLPVYSKIAGSYNRTPIKPVIDGEPIYEDHPVCFNANDLGITSAYDVRKAAWLDLFAGAFGHTYGCHDVWQFFRGDSSGINNPHLSWQKALELPGANQMKYVRKLLESFPMLERVPDHQLLRESDLQPAERIQATRGRDYLFVYSAAGKSFTLKLGVISGKMLIAYWFNPRNGTHAEIATFENAGTKFFKCPSAGYGNDWVLVVQDFNLRNDLFTAPAKK